MTLRDYFKAGLSRRQPPPAAGQQLRLPLTASVLQARQAAGRKPAFSSANAV